MEKIDCEKLKQNRDDALTQLVMVQIEAKENTAKKGVFGFFSKAPQAEATEAEITPERQEILDRLAAAQKKYDEAKKIYEENCKK
jgi:hypothetical protein